MARISASIPDELKDELYQQSLDSGQPISHIIADALKSHLGQQPSVALSSRPKVVQEFDTSRLEDQIATLALEIQSLKTHLTTRTPPKGVRFF